MMARGQPIELLNVRFAVRCSLTAVYAEGRQSIVQMRANRKRIEMPKKQVNPNQQAFDFLDTIPDFPNKRSARPWYYITRWRNSEMLLEFDAYGKPVWVQHDLRHTKPHMYNCLRRCRQAASDIGGEPRACHYDRHSKNWTPYSIG
jgi:hypothetical protein